MTPLEIFKNDYTITCEFPIAWGDMDAYSHVNNVVFFKLFEFARIKYFEAIDIMSSQPQTVGPILAKTSCKYIQPVFYPEHTVLGAKVTNMDEFSFEMAYGLFLISNQSVAAVGDGKIVSFDYQSQKKAPVPEAWRIKIQELEKTTYSMATGNA